MRAVLILVGFAGFCLLLFIYQIKWSPAAKKAQQNVVLSQKIEIGMTSIEVEEIMGEPDEEYMSYGDQSVRVLFYRPPFAASAGIEIYIDEEEKVKKIIPFEAT